MFHFMSPSDKKKLGILEKSESTQEHMSSCSASPFEEGGLRTKNLFLCLTLLIQEKKPAHFK